MTAVSWWDDPQHRDTASYVVTAMLGAAVAGAASLLRQWPERSLAHGVGLWLTSLLTGGIVLALCWTIRDQYPGPVSAAVWSAAWLGHRVIDRIAYRALGDKMDEESHADSRR